MNCFERHGIKWLSASSLNTFQAEPAYWIAKYLFKMKDEVGPGAWRGTAVEAGLDHFLYKRDEVGAKEVAQATFEREAEGEVTDEIEAERNLVPDMLLQAIVGLKDRPVPIARQLKIQTWLDEIDVPVIGYLDYAFEDRDIDLKTTKQCPSSIATASQAHKRQVALYMKARKRQGSLLYATNKKHAFYDFPQEEADEVIKDLTRIAKALQENLRRSESKEDVARLHAPNFDSFYWSNEMAVNTIDRGIW